MSKKLSKILIFLSFMIVIPFTMMLTGCGPTPVNNANAVKFYSDLYDEETGYAVFEVDVGVETELTYKINPSVWSGYITQFHEIEDDYDNETDNHINYDLSKTEPKIIVYNMDFKQIKVRISVNGLEDYCLVRLKEYPTEIYLDEDKSTEKNDFINSSGNYSIHVFGKFIEKEVIEVIDEDDQVSTVITEKEVIREITDDKYRFLVESSDPTVVNVLDSSRLKVCSLKNKLENATIKVTLIDTTGSAKNEKYILTLNLQVILSPKSSFVRIDGFDSFIPNKGEATVDLASANLETELSHGSTYYKISFDIELFDESGIYITYDEYSIECASDSQSFVDFDAQNQIIKVRKPSNSNELTAQIKIVTSANNASNSSYVMLFTLKCIFPA